MQPSGQARTEIDILDVSVLVNTGLKGIIGVCGVTERGAVNKPVLIGSWLEFQRVFGGPVAGSNFVHIAKRALEAGGRLKVSRVAHYTNISDATTIQGTKALLATTQSSVSETRATAVYTITTAGVNGNTITAQSNTQLGVITLGSYTVQTSDTPTLVAAGLAAAIQALTGTHGYNAANTAGALTITAPIGSGAGANAFIPSMVIVGTTAGTFGNATFTGGVTAVAAYTLTATAKSIGAWGNSVTYQFKAPGNGVAGTLDLYIDLAGYPDLQEVYKNISTAFTPTEIAQVNSQSKLVDFSSMTGTLGVQSSGFALATGVQVIGNIVTLDYLGDATSKTGIHSFDDSTEIVKISVPELAIPAIDIALAAYADMRKDMRAIVRTPIGLDGQGIIAYRNGTSPYSFTGINTWRASMFTGGLRVTNPFTGIEEEITEIGDVLAAYSRKDNTSFEWFTVGGPQRGLIKNSLGVVYNLGASARSLIADAVDNNGVNAVITHETFGDVIWGNSTLQKANTLLKHDNVADLVIALVRGLKPLAQSELFNPNDIETWKNIYRKITPFLDYIQDNRGIWKYLYQGDQDIDDISQAVVNTPANIDAGQYIFNLFISPKVGLKYQGIKVILSNSGVNFEELAKTI